MSLYTDNWSTRNRPRTCFGCIAFNDPPRDYEAEPRCRVGFKLEVLGSKRDGGYCVRPLGGRCAKPSNFDELVEAKHRMRSEWAAKPKQKPPRKGK